MALGEPTKPSVDDVEIDYLFNSSGKHYAISEECKINTDIPNKIRMINDKLDSWYKYPSRMSKFDSARVEQYKKMDLFNKSKICYLSSGETKASIITAESNLGAYYEKINKQYAKYERDLEEWRVSIARKEEELRLKRDKEETEKQQRLNNEATRLANALGKVIVNNLYDGGADIAVELKEHDLRSFSQDNLKLKLNITWTGRISGEPGYGADGILYLTTSDGKWKISDWSPQWKSSKLNEYIQGRQAGRFFRELLK